MICWVVAGDMFRRLAGGINPGPANHYITIYIR
jgi:hypothetical protein